MSGYTYGQDEPFVNCPYCGTPCRADFVDVGVGMVQCGPYFCERCHASEIGAYDKPRDLTDREKETGWYAPHSEPGSSANVVNGVVVPASTMKKLYKDKYTNNPEYEIPGHVEAWRDQLRKSVPSAE